MASVVERAIRAAKLDASVYEEVEKDEGALGQAMTVVAVAALANGLGSAGMGIGGIILGIVGALVGWVMWAALTWFVGTRVVPESSTQTDLGQMLRTTGFSAAPGVLNVFRILPIIGGLVGFIAAVWQLVAMVVAVRQALDYSSTGRAVGVCLVGFFIYFLVGMLLFSLSATGELPAA